MPQTVFGQSDAAARSLVTALNAASGAGAFCLSLTAATTYARRMEVGDIGNVGAPVNVQVFPGHDAADRVGFSGQYDDTYGVHVLLQQHVGAVAETQVPLLLQLRSEVAEFLMARGLTVPAAVHAFSNAHVLGLRHGPEGVYWLDRLEQLNCFYADMILTYRAAGLCRRNG